MKNHLLSSVAVLSPAKNLVIATLFGPLLQMLALLAIALALANDRAFLAGLALAGILIVLAEALHSRLRCPLFFLLGAAAVQFAGEHFVSPRASYFSAAPFVVSCFLAAAGSIFARFPHSSRLTDAYRMGTARLSLPALIIALLFLGGFAAKAETWPEIRKPAESVAGQREETQFLYMIDGKIYTVWRAPLGNSGGSGGGGEVPLLGRNRVLEDQIAGRLALGILTPDDYNYIRAWMLGSPDQYFGAESIPGDWNPTPETPLSLMDGTSEYFGVPTYFADAALLAYLEDPSQLDLTGAEFMEFLGAVGGYVDADSYAYAQLEALTATGLPPDVAAAVHGEIDWAAVDWTPFGNQYTAFFDNADLSNTNLNGALLNAALLPGNLNSTGLVGANLTGLDLTGLDFSNRNLVGLDLTNATGINWASFAQALNIQGVDYSGANLGGLNLTGKTIVGSDFSGAMNVPWASINTISNLNDVSFSGQNVTSLVLTGKQLQGANFSGVTVTGSPTFSAKINSANTNLSGINLAGTSLSGLNFTARNYSGANFTGATGLVGAQLKTAAVGGLTGAVLTGTGITRAQLAAPPNARPAAELDSITW